MDPALELTEVVGLLAPALSDGRRTGARLVTGPARAFATTGSTILVPWPPLGDQSVITAGMALQASPSKDTVLGLDVAALSSRQRRALRIVEGRVALGWVAQRWPGLSEDLERWLPTLTPLPADENAGVMVELALGLAADRRATLEVPRLLGSLPLQPATTGAVRRSVRRATSRMPWSHRQVRRRTMDEVPVGGSGGDEAPASGVPPSSDPMEEDLSPSDRRVGIPYPEWNGPAKRYRPDFVTVLERRPPGTARQTTPRVSLDLAEWFRRSPTRMRQTRLEDGCDIDVDAVVDCHVRQATGEATDARVYSDLIAAPRDVATALLLDSTSSLQVGGGRVFALELVCADALVGAMARTGERFGVFAFRGDTRHRVEVLVLRGFDDPPSTRVSRPELRPHGYTRLGAALRHVSARLQEVPAQRHILLSLGDGLPSDEGYEGAYAEADVAKAVEEATDAGIIVFHIGVGRVRRDPLVDMFGPVRSRRIKSSEELPDLLNDVYHALRGQ